MHALRAMHSFTEHVPLNGLCGHTLGGIAAYSNGSDTTFTNRRHYEGHFFTGYQWQCVEFARRWLLHRKGLALPRYDFAAHLVHVREVHRVRDGTAVRCVFHPQGGPTPPLADSLIVYPGTRRNLVGHVGVITEVTPTHVRVADQNRFFHHWGGKTYAAEFDWVCEEGRYYIRDAELECRGWLTFPGCANREDGVPFVVEPHMRGPVSAGFCRRVGYVAGQVKSRWTGRETISFNPNGGERGERELKG